MEDRRRVNSFLVPYHGMFSFVLVLEDTPCSCLNLEWPNIFTSLKSTSITSELVRIFGQVLFYNI